MRTSIIDCRLRRWLAPVVVIGFVAVQGTLGEEVQWRTGREQFARMDRAEVSAAVERLAGRTTAHHIVAQFEESPDKTVREVLRRAGVTLLRSLGGHAYFASLNSTQIDVADLESVASLAGIYAIDPRWKQDPRILAGAVPDWAVVSEVPPIGRVVSVYVLYHGDVSLQTTATAVAVRHGATVRGRLASLNGLVLEMPETQVAALADDDAVQWIEFPLPQMGGVNDSNRQLSEVDLIQSPPYGLTGAGVTSLVYDAGTSRDSHVDFQGRLAVLDSAELSNHATHVACTLGGAGIGNASYKGMAPGVSILSYGLEFDNPYIFLYSNPADLESDYNEAINVFGADLANNSIGTNIETNLFECEVQGNYGVTSALIDAIVAGSLGTPLPVIWAGGNERQGDRCDVEGFGDFYSVAPPAGAKNHICVGAVNSNDDTMTDFSAWGPLDDGRLKPDIVGPGCQVGGDGGVTSCGSHSDTAYTTLCGTSMAAPTVSGIVALLLEDFRAQFLGLPDPVNSTLKALLIHNAQDILTFGPDYMSGYGSVRARQTVDFLRSGQFLEAQVDQGDTYTGLVQVQPGDADLKMTLVWDDVPGTPNVISALVNDLDLRVFDPSGVRHFPWTLDPAAPQAAAVRSAPDHVNNVEQVFVQNPSPGAWRVEVRGFSVSQGPQTFSLCTSRPIVPCTSKGVVTLDADAYGCQSAAQVQVVDCDLNIDAASVDTVTVSAASLSDPVGGTVLLTETAPDSSVFVGSLALDAAGSAGALLVSPGDTITATYVDTDDGAGGQSVSVTASADVDCTGPLPSNVQVADLDIDRASITFDTDEYATATVHFGLNCGALTLSVTEPAARLFHGVPLYGLQSASQYFYAIESADLVGNSVIDDNAGACYSFFTRAVVYDFPLDTDPGWDTEGDWAFGQPTGGGSLDGDPFAGHTGTNVYGTNLEGNYAGDLAQTQFLTTLPLDLSQRTGTELRYWRWLLIEPGMQDFATVEISTDAVNWLPVWDNWDTIVYQAFWVPQRFDISSVADGQSQVFIRWGLGPTSPIIELPGWNIDDIQIVADGTPVAPTCDDGVLNQNEERVDCGGLCPPCECLDDVTCADGLYCNGVGWCDVFGRCQAGETVDCTDGIACTIDSCNEVDDVCDHTPTPLLCDDGLACNGIETCHVTLGCQPDAFPDCNANGEADLCDIDSCDGDPSCGDCNANDIPDMCDIAAGAADANANGIPDDCEASSPMTAPAPHDRRKNRYLSFVPNNGSTPVAFQVTLTSSLDHAGAVGTAVWLDVPDAAGITEDSLSGPVTRVWPESVVHVTGCFIAPVATYAVRASADGGANFSAPIFLETAQRPGTKKWWGDIVGDFDGFAWSPPQGITNIDDAVAIIKKWQDEPTAPHVSATDIEPQFTNRVVNINDVYAIVQAFQGGRYPYGCTDDPCFDRSEVPCP